MPRKILLRNRRRIRGFEDNLDKIYSRVQASVQENHQYESVPLQDQASSEPQDVSFNHLTPPQHSSVSSASCSSSSSSLSEISVESYPVLSRSDSSSTLSEILDRTSVDNSCDIERITDDSYGLHLLIAKVFQAANLHEKNQKRFYSLFKILIDSSPEILPYKDFKAIMFNLAPITAYKFTYCIDHEQFIEAPNLCCYQYNKHGQLVVFSLLDTVKYIINNNINYLVNSQASWSNFCQTKLYQDLWKNQRQDGDIIRLTFLINSDDAQMIKSSKVSTTPVPFTVAELPNHRRLTKDNVFNLGIYHGPKSFPTDLLWDKTLIEPLQILGVIKNISGTWQYSNSPLMVETNYGLKKVLLRVGAIIMDTVAKAKNLNVKLFNGYNGCPYCMIQGCRVATNENATSFVMVYPYDIDEFNPRKTSSFYQQAAVIASNSGRDHLGVKGDTILHRVVSIPDQIPIDYMHAILEGVFRFLFTLQPFKSTRVCQALDRMIKRIHLPHDQHRKFRKITEIAYWKASECRLFLLHLVPLLKNLVDGNSFYLILTLSTFTKILLSQSVTQTILNAADKMIRCFMLSFQEIYGIEKMRFNIHLLSHLIDQYKFFGSLASVSSFIYENNVYLLKKSFHGTRGHLDQMAKKYVLAKGVTSSDLTLSEWARHFDSNNDLKLHLHQDFRVCTHAIGNQDPNFSIPNPIKNLLNLRYNLLTLRVHHRFKFNHEEFQSVNYRYQRSSRSCYITFKSNLRQQEFAKILAFLTLRSKDEQDLNDYILVLIEKFKKSNENLLSGCNPTNSNLLSLSNSIHLKNRFFPAKSCKKMSTIDLSMLISKAILVPDKYTENLYWISSIDSPFEHD